MALGPRLDLRQTQALVLTPQLQQAIRLLQLSNLELEAVIAEEISKNPLLEAASGGDDEGGPPLDADAEVAVDSSDEPAVPGADELMTSSDGTSDQPLDFDWDSEALETDSFADVVVSSGGGDEDGPDFERMEYTADSLSEHLLNQLHGASGTVGQLARVIAEMLEETGYLDVPVRDIAEATEEPVAVVGEALGLVQSLDPPGVGARNLSECLALQAKAADRYDPAMARLIDNLDLLAKGRMADLKRICGVDDEDLADMVRELRAYDPKPGCQFSSRGAESVSPDVFVRRTRLGFAVELNQATLPRLLVNRRYYQELKTGPQDKKSRAWLSECLASANWLVKALDQRARTIVKVVSEIVKRQQGFFEKGVAAMKPMTLREIADAIEMHESTISRVTSNKYLLCDRGLFELKYFFGSGVASTESEGEGAAAEAVKAAIREIIESEADVLSDDAIAGLLKQRGFDCARRTVVKYRESMGIGSSIHRRRQRKMAGAA
ncbi:RNA polymerase factor sigma-54 [Sphingomonas sediminicola]|uniref:RNA polymerase sigma-54 factor n=1 Tax=Sphingomonas sediminicola TaxID=386874 RepID=A0ABX6T7E5_9SPHN|nr:RNA polymerase factor sigma-54 [Sphingomonas sediminicola]QNP45575.1 RNA polymerase factor sigma-54 [Sphingomonas sediminicola]